MTTPQRSNAIEMIAAERERQQSKEGWTPEHDDAHTKGELALAAASYCHGMIASEYWPWSADWYKPKDKISNLVRAGALIVAEIERLQRKEAHNDAAQ